MDGRLLVKGRREVIVVCVLEVRGEMIFLSVIMNGILKKREKERDIGN